MLVATPATNRQKLFQVKGFLCSITSWTDRIDTDPVVVIAPGCLLGHADLKFGNWLVISCHSLFSTGVMVVAERS
jgi:hypothetical protein